MTKISLRYDENNLKSNKGVDKNYFRNLLSENILDLNFHNTFFNSKNFYVVHFQFCVLKFFIHNAFFSFELCLSFWILKSRIKVILKILKKYRVKVIIDMV